MDVSDIVMLFYCPSSIVYVYLSFAPLIMYLGTTTLLKILWPMISDRHQYSISSIDF